MKKSFRTMAIASVTTAVLVTAPLAMAYEREKEKSADNDTAATLEKTGTEQVAFLGVGVEPLHPAFWAHLRDVLEHSQGLLVAQVAKDSPADKAGVKEHDILMTYGDQKLFSPGQLVGLLHADKAGNQVRLGIMRDGKTQEIMVTLGEHATQTARHMSPHIIRRMPWFTSPAPTDERNSGWESFDSMSLQGLGDNRYKVDIGYETEGGKIEHRTFEGTREEIHKDIMAQKDLPANEREHLLRSLDLPGAGLRFGFPVFMMPDGRSLWDYDSIDSAFWPVLPSES